MFVSVAATAPFFLFRGGGVADIISHVFRSWPVLEIVLYIPHMESISRLR